MEVLHRWHEQSWSAALAARSHTERARDRRGVGRGDRKFARSLGLRARVCLRVNHRLGGLDWGFDMIVRSALLISAATVLIAGTAQLPSSGAAAGPGSVQIIQAVPGGLVDVSVDGKPVGRQTAEGKILGPLEVEPGNHVVEFSGAWVRQPLGTAITVRSGTSTDVVFHRPASAQGAPVINTYTTPKAVIGPGKARVLIAHTATVAPADVRVDGRVIFTNIANGEYAQADVPAGVHRVSLLPTGQRTRPILGPIDVTLAPQTVTMVYAVGSPTHGSMSVIAHVAEIAADGTVVPDKITTGSAGLAAYVAILPFVGTVPPPTG